MAGYKLTFLYGSQTGCAQDVAERLWREAKYYGLHGPVFPMDDYPIQDLINESTIVFVCSTTGQGDEPDNMKKFWKFLLKRSLPNNSLDKLNFAVLGLGDSSYVKFNFCAKRLYRRLLQLGAQPLMEPGYADEQHDLGIDAVIHPWLTKFWETLSRYFPAMKISSKNELPLFPPRWLVTVSSDRSSFGGNIAEADLKLNNSARVSCMHNERVTAQYHFQDTRFIKFTLEGLKYAPGDVLSVKPKNSALAVEQFFNLFAERKDEISPDVVISVDEISSDMPVPVALLKPVNLKTLAEQYWDLNMVPRRYAFELLSHFTDSDLEQEKLREFASSEGQDELYTYCNRPKRTILEVLADFPHASAKIPLHYFFELFQPIRPRAFSIASSPRVHAGEIHILVAVVRYKTNLKLPRIGLCSNWLASLKQNDTVIVQLKPGSFSFPSKKNVPAIMIGPGTGIAPFRSYAFEESCDENAPKNYVFFGNRYENSDFYFKDEWLTLQSQKKIKLFTAFSRDQDDKIYVQHLIENNGPFLAELVGMKNAHIFVAGNSKNMPDSVRNAFIANYARYQGIDKSESEMFFAQLEQRGRYQTETWS